MIPALALTALALTALSPLALTVGSGMQTASPEGSL